MARSRWFGWITGVTHHDLHHQDARWNFGLYFTWWDRWMGTEHPEYVQRFEAAADGGSRPIAAHQERAA
jgi:sterol desaturase/sphingolipid hydroxylase (fatty acid hydroxylase superfamily)